MENRSHGIPTGTSWEEWAGVTVKTESGNQVPVDYLVDILRRSPIDDPQKRMALNRILPERRQAPHLTPKTQKCFDLFIQFDDMWLQGKGESPEADKLRDQIDAFTLQAWEKNDLKEALKWAGPTSLTFVLTQRT